MPLTMHGQYIKDLSFENPRAPQSLIEQTQPQLTLNVPVTNRQFDTKTFEVALSIEASAKTPKDEPLFMLELVYAGTVTLGEVPQDAFGPLLFIETPRLLFPFARAVIANATREAGFPPLNIAPVDFVALYRQQPRAIRRPDPGPAERQRACGQRLEFLAGSAPLLSHRAAELQPSGLGGRSTGLRPSGQEDKDCLPRDGWPAVLILRAPPPALSGGEQLGEPGLFQSDRRDAVD